MKSNQGTRIGIAILVVLGAILYLAVSGVQANKSYYVTIQELHGMGDKAYTRHLRVAGFVQPGSIQRNGSDAKFVLVENNLTLPVTYQGEEPPPDTFKDNSQALAIGTFGRDGVFHATQLQAKCASKYAPAQSGQQGGALSARSAGTNSSTTPAPR
ncbi:MAG: cytochrome c maturation protein CcmE [Bacillota bacterium]|jgi:cytochrome c-type biogenesis protein CcmE|nr:cytochrome c maturation protein CcmE [Bacillota bacterium]